MIKANWLYSCRGSAQFCSNSWIYQSPNVKSCLSLMFKCTDQCRRGHVSRINSLPGLLNCCRQLSCFIQAEAVQRCAKLCVILSIIWTVFHIKRRTLI